MVDSVVPIFFRFLNTHSKRPESVQRRTGPFVLAIKSLWKMGGGTGEGRKLFFNDPNSLIPHITVSQAKTLYETGVVSGGMIPKVDCCIEALNHGVKKVIIMDGRVPHSILMEILTDEGAGTMVEKD